MNNNRSNQNNRRRGRGNRQNNGGGGQQLNRIDSRARGNAPQMLEKYRKLAQDAHLNGDRVQAEYYLQFADHYFRVIADARVRVEDQRTRQPGERWAESGDEGDDSNEFGSNSDFPSFDQPYQRQPREERPRRDEQREERSDAEDEAPDHGNRQQPDQSDGDGESEGNDANPYEPPENPFVRGDRSRGGLRPRRERDDRRPRRDDRTDAEPAGLDPASLPPAISASRDTPVDAAEPEAKPRKPRARRKPSADDAGGETLESVS